MGLIDHVTPAQKYAAKVLQSGAAHVADKPLIEAAFVAGRESIIEVIVWSNDEIKRLKAQVADLKNDIAQIYDAQNG